MYTPHKIANDMSSSPKTPRRLPTMPLIRLASAPSTPILPLTASPRVNQSSPRVNQTSPGRIRSTSRRFSYIVKSRASHYSLPLTIVATIIACFFLISNYRNHHSSNVDRMHVYGRGVGHRPDAKSDNGVSLLLLDEDELIAEDDLFWEAYTDPEPLSDEDEAANAEIEAHRKDVLEQDRMHSLRALIWWLAEGGMLPQDWQAPTKQYLRKIGSRGMERLLEAIDNGGEEDPIFAEGWGDYAASRYKIVVFSKTYCPFSKKAKKILDKYRLSPAPFLIELDQRSDMHHIQTLLHHLTGRKTVPNILLDFHSIGGSDEMTLLHAEGGLQTQFQEMQVLPGYRPRQQMMVPPRAPIPAPVPVPVPVPVVIQQEQKVLVPPADIDDLIVNPTTPGEEENDPIAIERKAEAIIQARQAKIPRNPVNNLIPAVAAPVIAKRETPPEEKIQEEDEELELSDASLDVAIVPVEVEESTGDLDTLTPDTLNADAVPITFGEDHDIFEQQSDSESESEIAIELSQTTGPFELSTTPLSQHQPLPQSPFTNNVESIEVNQTYNDGYWSYEDEEPEEPNYGGMDQRELELRLLAEINQARAKRS